MAEKKVETVKNCKKKKTLKNWKLWKIWKMVINSKQFWKTVKNGIGAGHQTHRHTGIETFRLNQPLGQIREKHIFDWPGVTKFPVRWFEIIKKQP